MSVHGIDVSDHQPRVDWQTLKDANIEFTFIKVTEGKTWKAETFKTKWQESKNAEILRGAYHFFRPQRTGEEQAKNFLEMLDSVGGLNGDDLAPVLDLEVRDGVTSLTIQDRALEWLKTIESKTKRKPIIYTSPGFWDGLSVSSSAFADYPLWLAHYRLGRPNIPGKWKTSAIWQYTEEGRVKGVEGKVDLNWFNGSLDGLKGFATGDISGVKSDSTFDNLINRGDTGAAVKEVQRLLMAAGYDVGMWKDDGDFGAQTEAAVERFQRDRHLPINGIVDPATLAKLKIG
jgi:lysozyme